MLQHGELSVTLSERPGVDCAAFGGAVLFGNPAGLTNEWTLYSAEKNEVYVLDDLSAAYETESTDGVFCWHVTLRAPDGAAAKADITAALEGDTLRFTLRRISEEANAQIVALRLNGLAAALASDTNARLAMPAHGGRLINPANAKDGQMDHRYNWILDSFGSCAVAYTSTLTALARVWSMDDQLTSRVGGGKSGRYAQLGALMRLRYTSADASYRRAKPERDRALPEDAEAREAACTFSIAEAATVTVEYIHHEPLTPETGWTVGAKRLCTALPAKRSDYYRDKMVYKAFVGAPDAPVSFTYSQIGELTREIYRRTGGAGQLVYIVGFQHEGHDSGYPDVFTPNEKPGSMSDLTKLAEEGRDIGAVISFHDNYDDAYAASPMWCDDDISRDHTGHLLRGGVWNGAQAYWNSMPYYASHKSEQRIQRTLARYPFLRDTYHLDVLTASVFRVDFRKEHPTGRQADLEARAAIVDQFAAKGLDVSSEACGLPFVGTISYFWHMQRVPRPLYEGDERIPMVPFLVHGKADYAGTHTTHPAEILDGLLYGGFYCNDVTAATPIKELTDAYFMLQAPLNMLRNDTAVRYETKPDGWKVVRYASGAVVAVQFEGLMCRVDIDGRRYVENGTAMIPQADGSTLLYRAWEEPYQAVEWFCGLPEGKELTVKAVGVDMPDIALRVNERGCVAIETELGVAYRATAN